MSRLGPRRHPCDSLQSGKGELNEGILMLEPSYLYAHSLSKYREAFREQIPFVDCSFQKGEQIWHLGEYIERVYYFESGVAKTTVVHEDGHTKTLYFSGRGSVYPGCHKSQFNIEKSLVTTAITPVKAMSFKRADFLAFAHCTPDLMADLLELYATWINLHIYEAAHQEYNSAFRRLCNLVYLLCSSEDYSSARIDLTQQDLADILALERENVSRMLSRLRKEGVVETHRGWFSVTDIDKLLDYCSLETIAG